MKSQCVFRQPFESTLRQRRITLENTIELWSIESIKQCVAANPGISFYHVFTVERELSTGQLKRAAVWRAVAIDWRCAPIMPGKAVSPVNADIYAVYGGVFTVEDKNAGLTVPALSISLFADCSCISYRHFAALTDIFCIAVTFLHARLLSFSARFRQHFFVTVAGQLSLGARVRMKLINDA